MTTALVTGATAGLGRAYAERLAQDGYDLVLVARDAARLRRTADALAHRFGADVEVLAADLSHPEACALVEERLADRGRPIDLLVNNAGFSVNQRFVTGDLGAEQLALDVMVRAVLRLSHAALGAMVTRGTGAVINVSSVAGWMPSGTYGAAKAYVIAFTEGLAGELQGTGVRAMVVCPGFTHTEFHERAGLDMSSTPGWMWLDADRVVADSLRDLEKGRVVSVPSATYKALSLVARHAPRGALTGGYRRFRRR
jgi:short-subunit dehydrogenase